MQQPSLEGQPGGAIWVTGEEPGPRCPSALGTQQGQRAPSVVQLLPVPRPEEVPGAGGGSPASVSQQEWTTRAAHPTVG